MTSISDTEVVNAPGGLVELNFNTIGRTNVAVSGTGTANATELVSTTVVCDGSPIIIEFQCGVSITNGEYLSFGIWIDNVYTTTLEGSLAVAGRCPISAWARLTPTAGTKTISVRWWRWSGSTFTSYIEGNCRVRVSKILQASQLLVTQSNAPIVTSLPVGNLVTGQEVDLYVTSPYVGYQRYKWNGTAWYVIGDSRAQGVWQSFTPTLTQSSNVTFTINYAKYVVFGKTVMVNFNLSPTSSGVLNNNILLGFGSGSTALPTAASASGIHGNFRWFDAGVSNWVGTICGSNTTSVFFTNDGNGNNAGFSGTLTSGDVIEGSFFYEMA